MAFAPDPLRHYSDPEFVRISISHPVQMSPDRDGCKLRYRIFGGKDLEERVIFLPGMFETCSSSVYLLQKLACYGFGCISLDLAGYKLYSTFVRGFIRFCQQQNIKRIHLIGSDCGGFDALQIASFPDINKQISILSITLINSFTEPWIWEQTGLLFKVLGSFAAKNVLFRKIQESGAIDRESVGAMFVAREVQAMEGSDVAARLRRTKGVKNAVNTCIDHKRIMSIETLNGYLTAPERILPSVALSDVRVATMKEGGDWPHIEVSADVGEYVLAHLRAYATEVPYLSLVPGEQEEAQTNGEGPVNDEAITNVHEEQDHANEATVNAENVREEQDIPKDEN